MPVQRRVGADRGAPGAGGRGRAVNDDTRKLLKVFGVAVTDAGAEAGRAAGTAARLSASASKEEEAQAGRRPGRRCFFPASRRPLIHRVLVIVLVGVLGVAV